MEGYQTISFSRRLVAYLIDVFLFVPVSFLLGFFLPEASGWITGLLFISYYVYFLTRRGATIGKKLVKIRVVNRDGNNPSLGSALLRETIGRLVSQVTFDLGYAWIAFDKKNQGFHDKIARTFVVATDASGNIKLREKPVASFARRLLSFLLIALLISGLGIFMFIYLFVAHPFQMRGKTMEPNYPDGGYYMSNKLSYKFGNPKRGDVVVFTAPPERRENFVKRIVGLPGEKIMFSGGRVYINGRFLEEPYLPKDTTTDAGGFLVEGEELLLPADSYFVLGDNRGHSLDSRAFGPIKKEDIVGKLWFKYAGL